MKFRKTTTIAQPPNEVPKAKAVKQVNTQAPDPSPRKVYYGRKVTATVETADIQRANVSTDWFKMTSWSHGPATIVAIDFDNRIVTGVAVCHPNDRFDPELGLILAQGRALRMLGHEMVKDAEMTYNSHR